MQLLYQPPIKPQAPGSKSLHIQFHFHMKDSAINALRQIPADIQQRIGHRERI
jgi:hypothetical protein